MLLVQYGYIFLVLIFLLLFSSPKGSENKETKKSELGKYISYCTLSRAITITYCEQCVNNNVNTEIVSIFQQIWAPLHVFFYKHNAYISISRLRFGKKISIF